MKEGERIWVVRRNADGSWRLLIHYSVDDGRHTGFGSVDLFADGRHGNASSERFGGPQTIWKRLPADAKEARRGWTSEHAKARHAYTRLRDDKPGWRFKHVSGNEESDVTFDSERGLPTNMEYRQVELTGQRNTVTRVLEEVSRKERDWIAKLEREAQAFLAAKRKTRSRYRGARLDKLERSFADAKRTMAALREKVALPLVRDQIDRELADLEKRRKSRLENAKRFATYLGKPAAAWTLKELDGQTHSLRDYSGQVVILDFWFRNCAFCLDAMPQLKEVATHFRARPVVLLGLNTEDSVKVARDVADEMKLNYRTLVGAGELPEKYGVRGFPTLVIIDQGGAVHDFHAGYSPTLKQEVIKIVEKLLR
ncbi:MAG: TlpA family protein disulfide reductase [Planctomycetota bacterium]|jgi:thiol-disulfide isomerase/thioredoxin/transposase